MTNEKEMDRAIHAARSAVENISKMVNRIEHCDDCDGEDCTLSDKEIIEGMDPVYDDLSATELRDKYHNCDDAEADLQKTPFEVEVRSDWYATDDGQSPRPHEYRILLTIGEPAVRIVGELGEDSVPVSACVQYQDGNESWVYYNDMSHEEHANLLTFAQSFTYS